MAKREIVDILRKYIIPMQKFVIFFLFLPIAFISQAQSQDSLYETDTIPRHYIGLRLGAGIDHIIIPNGQIGLHVLLFSGDKTRFSIDNTVGVFVPWLVFSRYYYPSIRYQRKVNYIWYGCSYGMEFLRVTDLLDEPGKIADRMLNRFDLSVMYELNNRCNFEFSIPIRIDHEIPVYLTGINATLIFKI